MERAPASREGSGTTGSPGEDSERRTAVEAAAGDHRRMAAGRRTLVSKCCYKSLI